VLRPASLLNAGDPAPQFGENLCMRGHHSPPNGGGEYVFVFCS
jgi:hypothetical protein